MANIIKIKRGLSTNISKLSLAPGELAVTLDTRNLYVGDSNGATKQIAVSADQIIFSDGDSLQDKFDNGSLNITKILEGSY